LASQVTIDRPVAHEPCLEIVFQYTKKDLTQDGDRLVAIGGIASQLQHSLKDINMAGLWRSHILEGLQWIVTTNDAGMTPTAARLPTTYIAPSWSWACIIGPLSSAKEPMGKCKTNWDLEEWQSAIEILDCQIRLAESGQLFG
jgi:hypothetical protein